jgi:hypothetical protein
MYISDGDTGITPPPPLLSDSICSLPASGGIPKLNTTDSGCVCVCRTSMAANIKMVLQGLPGMVLLNHQDYPTNLGRMSGVRASFGNHHFWHLWFRLCFHKLGACTRFFEQPVSFTL